MRVLVVTNMYPTPVKPFYGIFVKEQVDSLREIGVDVDVLAFDAEGKDKLGSYLFSAQRLRHLMREKEYDLIHAHYGLTGGVARMQVRCPVIVTFHGSDLLGELNAQNQYTFGGEVKKYLGKLIALCVARRIVVADLLRSHLWGKSAVTIPMGVDLSLFTPMASQDAKEQLGLPQDRRRVLFVGHSRNYIKRFDVAQEAVCLLKDDYPDVELLPLYTVSHDQVPLYMNACDVLVLTSMHEASPCVIKEALACNLPIVSVAVGDVAERIQGVLGCYLCERTPQDVAAKLGYVLDDYGRTNGREHIQSLSLQNIALRVLSVYENTLAAQR